MQNLKINKVIAAVIKKNDTFLIAKRGKQDALYGKWEFPGGKMEPGETEKECLQRELFEEFGVQVEVDEFLCSVPFEHKSTKMEMRVYYVTTFSGEFTPFEHQEIRWVSKDELSLYEFPLPDVPVIKKLQSL